MKNYSQQDYDQLRHSAAHLLAAAVIELYPEAKRTIGPAIENGFYYDFDFGDFKISDEDLPKIEQKMQELVKSWTSFRHKEVTKAEALSHNQGNQYKTELINELSQDGQHITIYTAGSFTDLCRGGHVDEPNKVLKFFKLTKLAGAYWRGDEKNKMLTRIYGTAFFSQKDLEEHLHNLEEAKQRDHKKLARELGLIVFSDLVGSGLPLYTPKGAVLRSAVYNYSRELNGKIGYGETALPNMNRAELFKVSGHYDKYKADMLAVHSHYSKEEFYLKPMNCPQHCVLYGSEGRSYRDLPVRYADFSVLYRDERPGEINGLLRSRAFTQDDGHCFCRPDQIEAEFASVLGVIREALETYGFKYWVRLSLHDPQDFAKYLGTPEIWASAEKQLRQVVEKSQVEYREGVGEAAIYGPKLDFMVVDSLGREWQLSTIQLDLNMPGRFGLEYNDENGKKQTPVMIHRAIIGSERFIGILIEHFGGAFPLWLSPVQLKLLTVSHKEAKEAQVMASALKEQGLRVELDDSDNTLGKKIVRAREDKVPYFAVVGAREVEQNSLALKNRAGEEHQLALGKVVAKLQKEVESKV